MFCFNLSLICDCLPSGQWGLSVRGSQELADNKLHSDMTPRWQEPGPTSKLHCCRSCGKATPMIAWPIAAIENVTANKKAIIYILRLRLILGRHVWFMPSFDHDQELREGEHVSISDCQDESRKCQPMYINLGNCSQQLGGNSSAHLQTPSHLKNCNFPSNSLQCWTLS